MEKKYICGCIAEYLKPSEIVAKVKEKFGKTIERHLVGFYANSKKWRELIKKRREDYLFRLDDIAISHKKVRIGLIEGIAERNAGVKDSVALDAISEARKEMEGDGTGGNISYTNIAIQYNSMTDDEIKKRQEQLMSYFRRQGKLIEVKGEVTDGKE